MGILEENPFTIWTDSSVDAMVPILVLLAGHCTLLQGNLLLEGLENVLWFDFALRESQEEEFLAVSCTHVQIACVQIVKLFDPC